MSINPLNDNNQQLRWAIYWVLILSAVGNMIGRISVVESRDGLTPMLSANDRSRWCTVRAIVDNNTYEISDIIAETDPVMKNRRPWCTIDLVRHAKPGTTEQAYYSSKPPLYPTMLAGLYSVIQRVAGVEMSNQSFYIMRLMLILVNVIPLVLYFYLLALMLEKYARTDWARIAIMACATWATFITTFAVTLNNHLPAAVAVMITMYVALAIWRDRVNTWGYFFTAGLFAAFAAANELPALSLLVAVGLALLLRSPTNTVLGFLPGAAVVIAAFFVTNHRAHGDWLPPYFHRNAGQVVHTLTESEPIAAIKQGRMTDELKEQLEKRVQHYYQTKNIVERFEFSTNVHIHRHQNEYNNLVIDDIDRDERLLVVDDGVEMAVHIWGNWYDYPGSYWLDDKREGIDKGEESKRLYAFNVIVGHHGILSLTPIWILSLFGIAGVLISNTRKLRGLGLLTFMLTAVCLVFFVLLRSQIDRNYGGTSCGFRWMFWLTPLWLLCLIPVADAMERNKALRWIGLIFFGVSVASASYAGLNPWSHPWIYDYWEYIGYPPQSFVDAISNS